MGSILVCLAGAPAFVTVEANARVTVSVAEIALVLCLWSVCQQYYMSVKELLFW